MFGEKGHKIVVRVCFIKNTSVCILETFGFETFKARYLRRGEETWTRFGHPVDYAHSFFEVFVLSEVDSSSYVWSGSQ